MLKACDQPRTPYNISLDNKEICSTHRYFEWIYLKKNRKKEYTRTHNFICDFLSFTMPDSFRAAIQFILTKTFFVESFI